MNKIILLMMERDALDSRIFEQVLQKKTLSKYEELSKHQPVVIKFIGTEGKIMPSTIGNYTGMSKSSLTRIIDDLEKKGMVVRENDPEDRRKVLISLTDKGRECSNYFDKVINQILSQIDEKDLEDYLQSLEKNVMILRKIAGFETSKSLWKTRSD